MALNDLTLLCTQADLEGLLSQYGVLSRADHDADGALNGAEQQALADAIVDGTETVYYYLFSRYSPEQLSASNMVNRWATYLSAYCLGGFRGNPIPDTLIEWAEKAEERMEAIADGRNPRGVPGIGMRRIWAPTWDNVRVDPRYTFKCIRVERGRSSKQPTDQPVTTDYPESYSREW